MLMVVRHVRIQACEMATQHIGSGLGRGHDRGVYACGTCLRAYAYPPQRWVLKASFSPVTVCHNPPGGAIVHTCIHGGEWFVNQSRLSMGHSRCVKTG